jgi:mannonate dehydratase
MPGMRVSIGLPSDVSDDHLTYAKQLGCEDVIIAAPKALGNSGRWELDDLVRLRQWVESHGLKLESLQGVPNEFWTNVRLGQPGREQEVENYKHTIRNIGRAGIPTHTHNFRPHPLYRTHTIKARGGAEVTAYDRALLKDELTFGRAISAEQMWEAYEYWLRAVVPVAEESNVRIGLHPDDPNDGPIGGVARIFSSIEGFQRAADMANSPNWGLLMCLGCFCEMGGLEYAIKAIRQFGAQKKIFQVHFRDIRGNASQFCECFIGDGEIDITRMMRELKASGFDGPLVDDHAPKMLGDEGWHFKARGYQTGYLMGMLRVLNDLGA